MAMIDRALRLVLAPSPPLASAIALVLRVGASAILIGFGQSKFAHNAKEVRAFHRYGLPAPEVFTYAIGTVELVGGVLLVLGLLTRLVASARSRPAAASTAASSTSGSHRCCSS